MSSPLTDANPQRTTTVSSPAAARPPLRARSRHPVWVHLAVLGAYLAIDVAVTWPHATYLAGKLPDTRDAGSYVWGFWWMAHAVLHLQDPWVTHSIAAPVGTDLGMHALMPLAGLVMLPVTVLFGPSAAFNSLSIMMPALMAYAMWRVAKLWLPAQVGALAAGAFFGFSSLLDFQSWVHLNLAAGALFLPITLEAAVRLRRRPGVGQAVVLGLVVGASMLVDQESAVLCGAVAVAATLPWLIGSRRLARPGRRARLRGLITPVTHESLSAPAGITAAEQVAALPSVPRTAADVARLPQDAAEPGQPPSGQSQSGEHDQAGRAGSAANRSWPRRAMRPGRSLPQASRRFPWLRVGLLGLAMLIALAVATPQLVAILHADAQGSPPATLSAGAYLYGIRLPDMFLPSPRITSFGLHFTHAQNSSTYGALPTLLALVGLVLAWRRRSAWLLAAFWLGAALLAVGSDILLPSTTYTPFPEVLNGTRVSAILPFTWFAKIPGLSGFREPSRIAELGLLSVALLAGYTVSWLRFHARYLLVVVLVLGVFEAGLTTPPGAKTMPDRLPALDNPIAADHSGSIVVDVPFGLRGGTGITGMPFAVESQVLATADGHPLADALLSRVPTATKVAFEHEPFFADLIAAQTGHYSLTPAQFLVAAKNAVRMHIGWVLLWVANKHLRDFLAQCGFRYVYRADGASAWRPSGYANAALPQP